MFRSCAVLLEVPYTVYNFNYNWHHKQYENVLHDHFSLVRLLEADDNLYFLLAHFNFVYLFTYIPQKRTFEDIGSSLK